MYVENSQDSQLAVLIPTKNRLKLLEKTLYMYSYFGFNGKVFIGDSSTDYNYKIISKQLRSNKVNFEFISCRDNNPSAALYKIAKIAQSEKYKYSVYHGDDDFLLKGGIIKLIQFLEVQPTYDSARGTGYIINLQQNKNFQSKSQPTGVYNYWNEISFEDELPIDRAINVAKNYCNLQFSITRTSAFINSLSNNNSYLSEQFNEYHESLHLALSGKIKYLKHDYLIRLTHNLFGGNSLTSREKFDTSSLGGLVNLVIFSGDPILLKKSIIDKVGKSQDKHVTNLILKIITNRIERQFTHKSVSNKIKGKLRLFIPVSALKATKIRHFSKYANIKFFNHWELRRFLNKFEV